MSNAVYQNIDVQKPNIASKTMATASNTDVPVVCVYEPDISKKTEAKTTDPIQKIIYGLYITLLV
jgi:hypothetical protein